MTKKPFLCALSKEDLNSFLKSEGEPAFRAKQIFDWVYKKRVLNPEKMKNIPAGLRQKIADVFLCESSHVETVAKAADRTKKLLVRLADGEAVETVIIHAPDRTTFCLSSQVGCPVQCYFCASGADGFVRNMDGGEIIEQFYHACDENGALPDNIVFMGIGEGLLNFQNLAEALSMLTDPEKIGMASRRITVSTSGWTKGIKKLADLGKQFNLAVSLHAADDSVRAKLIPEKFRRPIKEILNACEYYRESTSRMPTFEYTLIKGLNDSPRDAKEFAKIAVKSHAKVNLIPYNETDAEGYERPSRETINVFEKIMLDNHANVTARIEKGSSSNAACGQLRINSIKRN